jgi:glycosyltransferase involved in cell wall biosynthesis
LPRPRVLLLITQADIGGAQIHVLEILKRMSHQYRFVLAVGFEDYLTRQAATLDVEVRILKHLKRSINFKQDRLALIEVMALLRELKPDLLHTHSSKAGVIGRLAAWRLGVPSLFTAHGWAFTPGAPALQRAYGLAVEFVLCRLIGKVVTVSDFDYKLARRYFVGADAQRFLVRNGVSKPAVVSKKKRQKVLQIITVGRLNQTTKNQAMLIEVLARLDLPFHAIIVGAGESHPLLEEKIRRLNLQDKVKLVGEAEDIGEYLAKADIFTLTSNYEGLPLSILEAMSMGLPVVACDVGGVSEAVLHEQTGLLSARGDVLAFTENIKRLALNSALRSACAKQAQQHYEQNFTADRMIKELSEVYKQALR